MSLFKRCLGSCNRILEETDENFYYQSKKSNKFFNICKQCIKKYQKQYSAKNAAQIKSNKRRYYEKNKNTLLTKNKLYRKKNSEKIKKQYQTYRKNNKNKISDQHKKYRENNIDKIKLRKIKYYNKNKIAVLEKQKKYIETKMLNNMTWENHGIDWHIDHIIPLSYFKCKTIFDPLLKVAWCLENLRPLSAKENLSKSNKIPDIPEAKAILKKIDQVKNSEEYKKYLEDLENDVYDKYLILKTKKAV